MPYISLDNLTQYNGRLRDYIDGSFDKLDGANWRKTSAAQSVSCWPIPESPLEPEVTFKFSETQPESGTKGPDNPSTIVGVESVSCNVCESEGVYDTPYSIDLGGTYYGGTVNFATGVVTVEWEKTDVNPSVLDAFATYLMYVGTNTVGIAVNCEKFGGRTKIKQYKSSFSNRFEQTNSGSYTVDAECIYTTTGSYYSVIRINKSRLSNDVDYTDTDSIKNAFIEWFANNPTSIVYKLETPFTVQLTPVLVRSLPALSHYTPRQNTIYTSHESVQVGYAKSASKTSQDLANAIVALGGNV